MRETHSKGKRSQMPEALHFIHRFLPGSTPASPVLLLLHGTGGNEDSLIELGEELLPGAHLLSPRGKVLEHGMPRFFRRLSEGVFDLDDLRLRTNELAKFIQDSRSAYGLADNPMYAIGYSNGANIAANLLLTHGFALQGAVLFRPTLPVRPSQPPVLHNTPILLLAGEHDPMVSRVSVEALSQMLTEGGAQVLLRWQPTGHQLGMADVLAATQWLQDHLPQGVDQ